MSSIKARTHKQKSHPLGWLFCLAGALVASKLALRANRRRIRFAFATRRSNIFCRAGVYSRRFVFHRLFSAGASPRPTIKRRVCESRSEAELPMCPKRTVEDACPYKRYFTFFEKYVIILSTNNSQKLFLQKAVRGLLQLA